MVVNETDISVLSMKKEVAAKQAEVQALSEISLQELPETTYTSNEKVQEYIDYHLQHEPECKSFSAPTEDLSMY